jgi:hypothetical protein
VNPQQATADVIPLAEFIARRDVPIEEKLRRIARDLEALRILQSSTTEAQVATGAAMASVVDALADHTERLERIERGVLEAIAIGQRAEASAREAQASDVDLTETVRREQAARAAQAEELRALVAPIVADASRRAGNAGAAKTAGAFSLTALVVGLAAEPVETIKLLREIGPVGAAIAVVSLLVALVWTRRRRS